jgi:hypothetical protein
MPTITIKDETLQGMQPAWELELSKEQTTLREVIRSRVYQEVSEYNAQKRDRTRCLVPLTPAWQPVSELIELVDWQEQYERAIKAFEKRSYIVLANNRQITQLDSPIVLPITSIITFLKLIPLIGG